MKINIVKGWNSIPDGLEFELPMFTVLTGKNGSGKTHLFRILHNTTMSHVYLQGKKLNSIAHVGYSELIPKSDLNCSIENITAEVKKVWDYINSAKNKFNHSNPNYQYDGAPEKHPMISMITQKGVGEQVVAISKKLDKLPNELTESDVNSLVSVSTLSDKPLLNGKLALIFKTYYKRYIDNKLNKIYEEEGYAGVSAYLDNDEFLERYGEPPWDFLNRLLNRMQLPYRTNTPIGENRDVTFNSKLINKDTGLEITTGSLSTGELTLMSLALAVYNSEDNSGRTDFIILDEPDSPLHPSMSKLMLEILEEEIVKKHGIPVLLSTHSPTTIALAPPGSLYMMGDDKIPVPCSLQDSIDILSFGIPNLKVSVERKRQIFVENAYDVNYYETLFNIVNKVSSFNTYPQFLPPHNLNGTNCSAVKEIVRSLRDMGNDQVYGLIDWDTKNVPEKQIVVLGDGSRYAIENYIFEPHLLALYLIRKNFVSPSDLGLSDCDNYIVVVEKIKKDSEAIQTLVDSVQNKVFGICEEGTIKVDSELIGGEIISIREEFFLTKGHDLENKIKRAWPKLNSVRNNNRGDNVLKQDVLDTVLNELPQLISKDIVEVFKQFK
jgi:predicted ATPase